MIAFLIGVGVIFYGVTYSGILTLNGTPMSTLDALRGKISASPTSTGPPVHGSTVGTTGYSGGGGPGGAKKP